MVKALVLSFLAFLAGTFVVSWALHFMGLAAAAVWWGGWLGGLVAAAMTYGSLQGFVHRKERVDV